MSRKKSVTISRKPSNLAKPATAERTSEPGNVSACGSEELLPPFRVCGKAGTEETRYQPDTEPSMGFLGKALYGATYGVSYGVVFTVLAVGRLVPGRTIIGKAMADATVSAKQAFAALGMRPGKPGQQVAEAHDAPPGMAKTAPLVA